MTMARTIKLYKLPDCTQLPLVPLTIEDMPSTFELLTNYLIKYD